MQFVGEVVRLSGKPSVFLLPCGRGSPLVGVLCENHKDAPFGDAAYMMQGLLGVQSSEKQDWDQESASKPGVPKEIQEVAKSLQGADDTDYSLWNFSIHAASGGAFPGTVKAIGIGSNAEKRKRAGNLALALTAACLPKEGQRGLSETEKDYPELKSLADLVRKAAKPSQPKTVRQVVPETAVPHASPGHPPHEGEAVPPPPLRERRAPPPPPKKAPPPPPPTLSKASPECHGVDQVFVNDPWKLMPSPSAAGKAPPPPTLSKASPECQTGVDQVFATDPWKPMPSPSAAGKAPPPPWQLSGPSACTVGKAPPPPWQMSGSAQHVAAKAPPAPPAPPAAGKAPPAQFRMNGPSREKAMEALAAWEDSLGSTSSGQGTSKKREASVSSDGSEVLLFGQAQEGVKPPTDSKEGRAALNKARTDPSSWLSSEEEQLSVECLERAPDFNGESVRVPHTNAVDLSEDERNLLYQGLTNRQNYDDAATFRTLGAEDNIPLGTDADPQSYNNRWAPLLINGDNVNLKALLGADLGVRILDAENIGFTYGKRVRGQEGRFDIEGVKKALDHFLQDRTMRVIVVGQREWLKERLQNYIEPGRCEVLIADNTDDKIILRKAFEKNCSIVSRDQFRNEMEDCRISRDIRQWYKEFGSRLQVMYTFDERGQFQPNHDLEVPVLRRTGGA
eukprot:TRINITY_DN4483_c0_g1_i1.p1 TRINITY_DN4483_c0_g1~~TRINITY_DN4483_c0_g1_i1.p1  ORF type:complete len:677 (+),score=162.01 TRINITY_DN4483_c0_g1_i1:151-2181(+)